MYCGHDLDPIQGQGQDHRAFELPTVSETVHAGGDDRSPLAGLSGFNTLFCCRMGMTVFGHGGFRLQQGGTAHSHPSVTTELDVCASVQSRTCACVSAVVLVVVSSCTSPTTSDR